ncbi:MAG: transglycosylase SLT domain-containing protein [Clostridiales Family XIII bacterium]|jgi:hypothetical protein|nr:transglycosylase SLT domain-containing protein [Clostridiales Family XIII bacterium]
MVKLKKFLAILFSAVIIMCSVIPASASGEAYGKFFLKDIVINGVQVVNYNLQYPFFIYDDLMYMPLTPDMGDLMGFGYEMDWERNVLKLWKKEASIVNIRDNRFKNDANDVYAWAEDSVLVTMLEPGEIASASSGVFGAIAGSNAAGRQVDLGGKPVIMVGGILYLPLRTMADNAMGWDLHFDPNLGICISTHEETPAASFFPSAQAGFNKGLADYINQRNKNVSVSRSQELVFLFKRAAMMNNLDTKLLLAVAQKESNFRTDARNRSGATGLMQIMPKTAAAMGVTTDRLLDAKTSIDKGAEYIRTQLNRYDDNVGLALSAYNQGSGNVSRGTFSRGYAESVNNIMAGIDDYLVNGGYGTTDSE